MKLAKAARVETTETPQQTAATPIVETAQQTIARLTAENAALQKKVDEKPASRDSMPRLAVTVGGTYTDPKTKEVKTRSTGAISIYYGSRFPMTKYINELEKIARILTDAQPCYLEADDSIDPKTGKRVTITFSQFVAMAAKEGLLSRKD